MVLGREQAYNHQARIAFHSFHESQQPMVEKINAGLTDPHFLATVSNDYQGKSSAISGVDFVSLTQADKEKESNNTGLKDLDFASWEDVFGIDTYGSQNVPLQPSFMEGQPETIGVLGKRENQIPGQVFTSNFGERQEFGGHPQIQEDWQLTFMDSQDEHQSFTTLLQSGLQNYKETPSQLKMTSTKKSDFSIEEDILLVKAWLNTSSDSIQGNDKKGNKFWHIIMLNYHENKKENMVERTAHSLSNRWSSIQKFTNKFCGYLVQIETKNSSGISEQDKINAAKDMYRDKYNIAFQFEHCWNLLKTVPKWNQLKGMPRRKSIGANSSPQLVIHLGEDTDDENVIVDLERPLGKKAAKERERKRKSKDCGKKEIVMEVLTGLTEVKKRSYKERKQNIDTAKEEMICIEKQKLEIELRKEAREQKKDEIEIMLMDTTNLTPIQLEYIHSLQMEIIQKRRTN